MDGWEFLRKLIGKRIRIELETASGSPVTWSAPVFIIGIIQDRINERFPPHSYNETRDSLYSLELLGFPNSEVVEGKLIQIRELLGVLEKGTDAEQTEWYARVATINLSAEPIGWVDLECWSVAKIDFNAKSAANPTPA